MVGAVGQLAQGGLVDGLFALTRVGTPARSIARQGQVEPASSTRSTDRKTDRVELSGAAHRAASAPHDHDDIEARRAGVTSADQAPALTEEELAEVRELRGRDREVRTHEQAHSAAAGSLGGGPSYEFTTGPDGKRYATGGEVSIDTAPIAGDPARTISKMQQVRRAALAPAEPSGQDRRVAAKAAAAERKARAELQEQKSAERSGATEGGAEGAASPETAPTEDGRHHPAVAAYAAVSRTDPAGIALNLVA